MKLQVLSTIRSHLCWKCKVLGCDRTLSNEEEVKKKKKKARTAPHVIIHLGLKLSRVAAERSSNQWGRNTLALLPPETSETESWAELRRTRLDYISASRKIPAAVELDELKELYKQKKDFET